jgi:hypothetical protein
MKACNRTDAAIRIYTCDVPGGDISRGTEVLAESTYSDRAVFPGVGVTTASRTLPGGGHVVLPGSSQLDYLV